MRKQEIGQLGEEYAAKFLVSKSYKLLSKNFHSMWGEIDLVMLSPSQELVFVEVKTRSCLKLGTPEESINHKKIHRIIKTSIIYLLNHNEIYFRSWRIDLIALKLSKTGRLIDLKQYKNILDGC